MYAVTRKVLNEHDKSRWLKFLPLNVESFFDFNYI